MSLVYSLSAGAERDFSWVTLWQQKRVALLMVRMAGYSQGTGGGWDCLPRFLTWPVTQQPVAVVSEAATRGTARCCVV